MLSYEAAECLSTVSVAAVLPLEVCVYRGKGVEREGSLQALLMLCPGGYSLNHKRAEPLSGADGMQRDMMIQLDAMLTEPEVALEILSAYGSACSPVPPHL